MFTNAYFMIENNIVEVVKHLSQRKVQLDHNPFCHWMKNPKVPTEEKISFAPKMYFFVLGFRDILLELEDHSFQSPLQDEINQHCKEDAHHWIWYLEDCEKLANAGFFSFPPTSSEIYQRDWYPVRKHLYKCMKVAEESNDHPFQKLVLIQVLESAFESFNDVMAPVIEQMGKMNSLSYFGNAHQMAEEAHESPLWIESDLKTLQKIQCDGQTAIESIETIDYIFDGFEKMFNQWSIPVPVGKHP